MSHQLEVALTPEVPQLPVTNNVSKNDGHTLSSTPASPTSHRQLFSQTSRFFKKKFRSFTLPPTAVDPVRVGLKNEPETPLPVSCQTSDADDTEIPKRWIRGDLTPVEDRCVGRESIIPTCDPSHEVCDLYPLDSDQFSVISYGANSKIQNPTASPGADESEPRDSDGENHEPEGLLDNAVGILDLHQLSDSEDAVSLEQEELSDSEDVVSSDEVSLIWIWSLLTESFTTMVIPWLKETAFPVFQYSIVFGVTYLWFIVQWMAQQAIQAVRRYGKEVARLIGVASMVVMTGILTVSMITIISAWRLFHSLLIEPFCEAFVYDENTSVSGRRRR